MKYHYLNTQKIEENINDFLCQYPEESLEALFDNTFCPETFTIEEKRHGIDVPFFSELSYQEWIQNLVISQLKYIYLDADEQAVAISVSNVHAVLDYCMSRGIVIYSQEFVEIIRVIVSYTIYGTTEKLIQTAVQMNKFADAIIPNAVSRLKKMNLSLEQWFIMSIISGLSGIDMKQGPLSTMSLFKKGIGIELFPLIDLPLDCAVEKYLRILLDFCDKCSKPIFQWEKLCDALVNSTHLIWMTDDYIESLFDYEIIRMLLDLYPYLRITIVPKRSIYGNDLSYDQALKICSPELKEESRLNRLDIINDGPKMAAINLRKLSKNNALLLNEADAVIIKGCRIHEMLQGGLRIPSFSCFNVVASTSEKLTGFKHDDIPIILLYLDPGEYSFWGVMPNEKLDNYNQICCDTKTHCTNRNTMDLAYLINEYKRIKKLETYYLGNIRPLEQELSILSRKIEEIRERMN